MYAARMPQLPRLDASCAAANSLTDDLAMQASAGVSGCADTPLRSTAPRPQPPEDRLSPQLESRALVPRRFEPSNAPRRAQQPRVRHSVVHGEATSRAIPSRMRHGTLSAAPGSCVSMCRRTTVGTGHKRVILRKKTQVTLALYPRYLRCARLRAECRKRVPARSRRCCYP